jgi:RNA polymerase-interacting CarD/CdnL/TRCF family regulator
MIPLAKAAKSEIREVVHLDVLENALSKFHQDKSFPAVPLQQRIKLDSLLNQRSTDMVDSAYLQGFRDGIRLWWN